MQLNGPTQTMMNGAFLVPLAAIVPLVAIKPVGLRSLARLILWVSLEQRARE